MFKNIGLILIGGILGSLFVGVFAYGQIQEIKLQNFIKLYSSRANELLLLKDISHDQKICIQYSAAAGDIDIMNSLINELENNSFLRSSSFLISNSKELIESFNALSPNKYECKTYNK
jgi:hypothetical protein